MFETESLPAKLASYARAMDEVRFGSILTMRQSGAFQADMSGPKLAKDEEGGGNEDARRKGFLQLYWKPCITGPYGLNSLVISDNS
eukprot:421284-Pelagomonas_calceolata.AAC.2